MDPTLERRVRERLDLCVVHVLTYGEENNEKGVTGFTEALKLLNLFCHQRMDDNRRLMRWLERRLDYLEKLRCDPAAREEFRPRLEKALEKDYFLKNLRFDRAMVLKHIRAVARDRVQDFKSDGEYDQRPAPIYD